MTGLWPWVWVEKIVDVDGNFFTQQKLPDILAIALKQQIVISAICYVPL
jgi:hypothetical protein